MIKGLERCHESCILGFVPPPLCCLLVPRDGDLMGLVARHHVWTRAMYHMYIPTTRCVFQPWCTGQCFSCARISVITLLFSSCWALILCRSSCATLLLRMACCSNGRTYAVIEWLYVRRLYTLGLIWVALAMSITCPYRRQYQVGLQDDNNLCYNLVLCPNKKPDFQLYFTFP